MLGAGGCQTVGYYAQAVSGQMRLVRERRPVEAVIAELVAAPDSHSRDQAVLTGLTVSGRIVAFAEAAMGLPAAGRFASYVELPDSHVVWNVFAAPELALTPRTWCYPFVGCAPYRGYFKRHDALRFASRLQQRGLEVHVGGVAAYSTLGWFDDPLLSSFVTWPEGDLAELLIHELAHGRVWVRGDVGFNEAYATFVGRQGAVDWLISQHGLDAARAHRQHHRATQHMMSFLLAVRASLQRTYDSDIDTPAKRAEKAAVLSWARTCYLRNRQQLGSGRFDSVMERINNAYLVSVATYRDLVPGFAALFDDAGRQWPAFFARVEALARLPRAERDARMVALTHQHEAHAGDDDGADEIQCEPFPGHDVDAEPTRAEHDDVGRRRHG